MKNRYQIILEKVVKSKIKPAKKKKSRIIVNPPDKTYGALFVSG